MNKENSVTKFPPVKTIESILGVDKGVDLLFNYDTGKYVVVNEKEVIGPNEDEYYYSGSAFSIDPYLVRDNIGSFFEYKEDNAEGEPDAINDKKEDKEKIKENMEGDVTDTPGPDLILDTSVEDPLVNYESGDLALRCGVCGQVTILTNIDSDVQIFMALNNHSYANFVCESCGTNFYLFIENGVPKVEENDVESEEKSK